MGEIIVEAVNRLRDEQIEEVLDFIGYLQWREGLLEDQSWFWSEAWQARIRAGEADIAAGRTRQVTAENIEEGLAWLDA
jgi:predicted transcriptional regulator